MRQYHELMHRICREGVVVPDRTGTGTRSIFGHQMRFDLQDGFPLLTTKKLHWKSIAYELFWFLRGETNARWLQERRITIWDEWTRTDGELGPIYGKQWRAWEKRPEFQGVDEFGVPHFETEVIDQIAQVIEQIKTNPHSRRHIVSAWNVAQIEDMALPPCHLLFQFYVNAETGTLSCQMYQRSADVFLGVPYNIASYALLVHLVAHVCGLRPGELIWIGGDCHLYLNHMDQTWLQLSRESRRLPQLEIIDRGQTIDDFQFEDLILTGYDPHPHIKAEVSK